MSDSPPLFDPAVHAVAAGDPVVRVELWCRCGLAHRQVDPVSAVLPQIESFRSRHDGAGHGLADPDDALAERELRREAGHRLLGLQDDYTPRERGDVPAEGFDWTTTDEGA